MKKLTKKTRKAFKRIESIIEANITAAEVDTTHYRTIADRKQHDLQTACTDTEERDLLADRDNAINYANEAIINMQKANILRDMFAAFTAAYKRDITDF